MSEYTRSSRRPDGLRSECKSCKRLDDTARNRAAKPWVKYRYGICADEYNHIMQNAKKCDICPNTEGLCLDHDHATGKIRGVLCFRCNRALGLFQEDTQRMLNAIHYLQKSGPATYPVAGPKI